MILRPVFQGKAILHVREEAVINGITFAPSPKEILRSCDAEFMHMPEGYSRIILNGSSLEVKTRFVCGHVNQMWRTSPPFVNVSVDVWDYASVHRDKRLYSGIGGSLMPLLHNAGFDQSGPDLSGDARGALLPCRKDALPKAMHP